MWKLMEGSKNQLTVKKLLAFVLLFTLCVMMYILFSNISMPTHLTKLAGGHWVPYTYDPDMYTKKWFEEVCIHENSPSVLEELPDIIDKWKLSSHPKCRQLYITFIKIYKVSIQEAEVVLPSPFIAKVKGWLNNDDKLLSEAYKQKVIMIYDEYTSEQNTYNPIRSKRPMKVPEIPEEKSLVDIIQSTFKDCDFCKYKEFTAEDKFGRIDNQYSYSASNTFKLDRYHGLFMLKSHNPINWTLEQFMDLMKTKDQWFNRVHQHDSSFIYPSLIWDLLPAAGASQIHPHVHGFLDKDTYQGTMELWRRAALHYNHDFPSRNYFTDIVHIHQSLGLAVTYGKAIAFANLVPKKDNEVVIISEKADKDFYLLWYFIIRGFLDDMKKYCYSSGIALPSLTGDTSSNSLPAYVRIVTRGAVADLRSDISSLELFTCKIDLSVNEGTTKALFAQVAKKIKGIFFFCFIESTNANTDPYKLIEYMRRSVAKRSAELNQR